MYLYVSIYICTCSRVYTSYKEQLAKRHIFLTHTHNPPAERLQDDTTPTPRTFYVLDVGGSIPIACGHASSSGGPGKTLFITISIASPLVTGASSLGMALHDNFPFTFAIRFLAYSFDIGGGIPLPNCKMFRRNFPPLNLKTVYVRETTY